MRIKICGITNTEDARLAVDLGADALGFIFYAKSPRCVTPAAAREIIADLPPFVTPVAVVVDEPDVPALLAHTGCRAAQVHAGARIVTPSYPLIRAIPLATREDLAPLRDPAGACAFLLDAKVKGMHGGTGRTVDWTLAREAATFGPPIILAGGLNPENVADAIRIAQPYAVDLNSGVEAGPGKKDPERLRAAFAAIRG
ncbi:MAG: phosphoribosylanthranilate isomerase [Armatimonadota bacterium]